MKKAIIIGAASGIGKSLSELLIQEGYEVGVTGRSEELFFLWSVFSPHH